MAKPGKFRRQTPPAPPLAKRIPAVDTARGVALLAMAGYHFCFDLDYFHLAAFDFYHSPFWLMARAAIVTLFLSIVGISLYLATRHGVQRGPFLRRMGWLVACAGLVSAASYAMFPASGIFFGVLHFIALASLLGLFFRRLHYGNLILGTAWIAAGLLFQHPWFDQPGANWLGFVTHKPITEDYVPLFPWFGVVLLGMFLGKRFSLKGVWQNLAARQAVSPLLRPLNWAGKHSLAIYMLHQPVLLGILYFSSTLKG